jgi:hypothetical protein
MANLVEAVRRHGKATKDVPDRPTGNPIGTATARRVITLLGTGRGAMLDSRTIAAAAPARPAAIA